MRHWLIRHPDQKFERPVSESDLIKMIESGKLSGLDEICPSVGYWFYLSDSAEVRNHLGNIALEKLSPVTEERTSTTLSNEAILEIRNRNVGASTHASVMAKIDTPKEPTRGPSLRALFLWFFIVFGCSWFLLYLME